jgi:RNA polymerase sigma-70 factor, ECF subfamily
MVVLSSESEQQIRRLLAGGERSAAATAILQAYGPEVYGFLIAWLRSECDAEDAFSDACEDLWGSLAAFEGRCSTRTWFYLLARHAGCRLRRAAHHHTRSLSPSEAERLVAPQRSTTSVVQERTRERFADLRGALSEDDQALLILRVDRALSWDEIALILCADGPAEGDQQRSSARMRKRFQALKERLRGLVREAEGTCRNDPR